MRKIKLTLAYDGTHFSGWQSQRHERTVQHAVETALAEIHKHPVALVGAGRTDAGVHATGQVAHFETDHPSLSGARFTDALNASLPHDVRVLESAEADPDFHARFKARRRVYRYYIYNTPIGLPHLRRYVWRVRRPLDLDALNRFAGLLVGDHDFTSFASALDPTENKVRTIGSSCFFRSGDLAVYQIAGISFLWKMVRTIVGTIIDCVVSGKDEAEFRRILLARDRGQAGPTAPARGLFLERVSYE
jgi:tRNA pseudouridine38-40 synthase